MCTSVTSVFTLLAVSKSNDEHVLETNKLL